MSVNVSSAISYADDSCAHTHRKKVKTGCQTCKLRKVKCDQGWPACRRCLIGGRHCNGYGVWGGGSNDYGVAQVSSNHSAFKVQCLATSNRGGLVKSPSLMYLTAQDQRCFEWYICRSSKKLPGAFAAKYWTTLMPQASTTEPAVRHAVLALASAHMEEVGGATSQADEGNDEQALLTVHQYNKSIKCLQSHLIHSTKASFSVALLTCTIFIYMEFLRGHYTEGIIHLEHGLSLLQKHNIAVGSEAFPSDYDDSWLVTIFTGLLVQAKLFGQLLRLPFQSPSKASQYPSTSTFRSVHHARVSIEHIMLRTFDLQEHAKQLPKATTPAICFSLLGHQKVIQKDLQTWSETYEATMSTFHPLNSVLNTFAYRFLRLYHHMAFIMAGTCLETSNKLCFDQHESVFLEIVRQCIEIHDLARPDGESFNRAHHDPEPSSPNSISDLGWIAPLYFTAINCRNHRLRTQAAKLLELHPHKEGIWSAALAITVAKQVINIEEGNFYQNIKSDGFDRLTPPTKQDLTTPTLPQEFRLSSITIVLPADRAGRLQIRCYRQDRNGLTEHINKEYGLPSRQWHDIESTI